MNAAVVEALEYYATPARFTDLGAYAALARELPEDLAALCRIVQGLVVHPYLGHLYGLQPNPSRLGELELRPVQEMLDRVLALEAKPLASPRAPSHRLLGTCRHFSVLLCAFLRARGVPARPRCGFASWFEPSRFTDHWVCEVWDRTRSAWRQVDAQLDAEQREACGIDFDPLDVPRDRFLLAGEAWQACRQEHANPKDFGILELRGLWFVRGNVIRDLAALAKRELLPWDGWGIMADEHESDAPELELLDRAAALTVASDATHTERLRFQSSEPGVRVPRAVIDFNLNGARIELPLGISNG